MNTAEPIGSTVSPQFGNSSVPYILILFILMPIIEIGVLIQVGSSIGLFATLAIVVLTAVLGTAMLRQQGMKTMTNARARLQTGQMPAVEMLEGVLLLIGGVLLLTPGFVTDAFGFACLIPSTRRWMARSIISSGKMQVIGSAGTSYSNVPPKGAPGRTDSSAAGTNSNDNVIEGEYRREDK